MVQKANSNASRQRRHERVRKKVFGTAERPRLNVFRSSKHVYAQIIDDEAGSTIVAASSLDTELKATLKTGGDIAAAKAIGMAVAKKAIAAGVNVVVFDRGGYPYHGRVAALADAAREGGLEF